MPRIMVVDDDPDVLVTLGNALKGAGHEVIAAASGVEALDFLDRNAELDLLLTDVIMPGLNGFNLARMARTRRPSLKILYLTGWFQTAEIMRERGATYGKVLTKPILPDDLRREVRTALAG